MVDHFPADALHAFVEVAGAHADYAMSAVGMVPAPELEASVRTHVQAVRAALALWAARHMNLNFTPIAATVDFEHGGGEASRRRVLRDLEVSLRCEWPLDLPHVNRASG